MNEKLRVLDLFSGIGGFSLGLERTGGFRTVAFCEIDPYCRAVLAKHWPGIPIFEDVRKLHAPKFGSIDLICGGFPCQPFSHAGKRMGSEDDRHLWPEYRRLVEECGPTWVLGENVVGLIDMGLDTVLDDLENLGYATRTFDIPACAVGARHERRRIWILAHANKPGSQGRIGEVLRERPGERSIGAGDTSTMAHTDGARLEESLQVNADLSVGPGGATVPIEEWWATEPDVGRVAHGVPSRAHRLRALGNAVVPQIPEIIGRAILQAEGMT